MPIGRATKLTPAIHQAIVTAIRGGVSMPQVAALVGVDYSTLKQWIQRGEGRMRTRGMTPTYVAFVDDIKRAYAEDEARRVLAINQAGMGGAVVQEKTITYPDGRVEHEVKRSSPQWQAHAWHLERSRPDQWGQRARLDVHMQLQALAVQVADELGVEVTALLAEAQALLVEGSHASSA